MRTFNETVVSCSALMVDYGYLAYSLCNGREAVSVPLRLARYAMLYYITQTLDSSLFSLYILAYISMLTNNQAK